MQRLHDITATIEDPSAEVRLIRQRFSMDFGEMPKSPKARAPQTRVRRSPLVLALESAQREPVLQRLQESASTIEVPSEELRRIQQRFSVNSGERMQSTKVMTHEVRSRRSPLAPAS